MPYSFLRLWNSTNFMKSTGDQRYPAFFKSPNSQVVLRLFANLFHGIFYESFSSLVISQACLVRALLWFVPNAEKKVHMLFPRFLRILWLRCFPLSCHISCCTHQSWKNSSLVLSQVAKKAAPWFPGCSMFPSKLLVPNLFPGRDLPLEHLPSLPTPPVPVPVHCQYQTSASTSSTSVSNQCRFHWY